MGRWLAGGGRLPGAEFSEKMAAPVVNGIKLFLLRFPEQSALFA
jgi:hypothetical protein